MDIGLILLLLTVVANVVMGLFSISKTQRTAQNYYFLSMTLALICWAGSSYLVDNAQDLGVRQVAAYVTYGGAFLVISSLFLFSVVFKHSYANPVRVVSWKQTLLLAMGVVFASSPLVVGKVVPRDTYTDVTPGPLLFVYIAILVVLFICVTYNIFKVIRYSANEKHRKQAKLIFVGSATAFVLVLITNAIIPIINGSYATAILGPPTTLILVGTILYSIIKHQLFDIRAAVTRGLAYLMSIASLVVVYSGIIYIITGVFIRDTSMSWQFRLAFIAIALLSAFIFSPIKRFFDSLTAGIFYRNSYSSEKFIDEFSEYVVKNYKIDKLIKAAMKVLERYLQPESVAFVIRTEEEGRYFIKSDASRLPTEGEISEISQALNGITESVVHVHQLPESKQAAAAILKEYGASLLVRLMVGKERLGYLVLSEKKNGQGYTSRDSFVLGLVSEELALAVQNALRFREIEGFNEKLLREVSEATHDLRASNAKLKALDSAKDEFISMASHQLRTPLTSIKGYLSMVLEGDAGQMNQEQTKMLQQAFASAQRMVYLISDLLNVSRIQTGKFVIDAKDVYLPVVVEEELRQVEEAARVKNIALIYNKPDAFPTLRLDDNKIRQVMMNFIDNAIYYTPQGGEVVVSLVEKPKSVDFTVTDNGIGVPKAEQHKLFTKFYRAQNARKARPDGTGLGLFMAQKVIIASGGAVIFRSKENIGSTLPKN